MHGGSGRVLAVKQKSAISVYVGLAALVLEGRALGGEDDDENFLRSSSPHLSHRTGVTGEEAEVSNVSLSPPSSVAITSTATRGNNGGVIHRISEKLMRLRQFPGTSRELDVVETSIAIPVHDEQYERQSPRLHHVASAREFQRNLRLTSIPASSSSNLSAAASVLHDIDVDWNDISFLLNGLDPIVNVPAFPLKLSSSSSTPIHHAAFRSSHSMSINQDSRLKLIGKIAPSSRVSAEKTTCSSPPLLRPKQQGPHCEKFLKKLGLLKPETPELEMDHMCNHINNYCRRWQFHLKKLLQVLSKAEDACIEVYLGPENNAILLEQWIITITDKPSSATMTIQALCSAIRSQLCFSQISSWIDLLRKAFLDEDESSIKEQMPSLFSSEIMQNPRLKKNLQTMQVNLDILFRIKPYDGTSCFNEKPNVHKFPDTIISDGLAICVCLKSLPRLEKIPTLNTEKAHLNGFSFTSDNRIKSTETPVVATATSSRLINDRMAALCHEKGKHRCKEHEDDEEEEEYEEGHCIDAVPNASSSSSSDSSSENASILTSAPLTTLSHLSHRERQLLKYKKRLMKRDKQKKKQLECEQQQNIFKSPTTSSSCSDVQRKDVIDVTENINSMEIPLYHQQYCFNKQDERDKKSTAIVGALKALIENENILTKTTLSIATQTEPLLAMPTKKCDSCGDQLQCFNCDKIKNNNYNQMASSTTSSSNSSVSTVSGTMVGNKANLLLQAIQRTANAHQKNQCDDDILRDSKNIFSSSKNQTPRDTLLASSSSSSLTGAAIDDCDSIINNNNNNNNNNDNSVEILQENNSDCRLCKRQKTKHNYTLPSISVNHASGDSNNYRRTMSECMVGQNASDNERDEYENLFLSSPPATHRDDINSTSDENLSYGDLKAYRRAFSDDIINQLPEDEGAITIKCHHSLKEASSQVHKLTPNVSLLNSNRGVIPISRQQRMPKINLSQLFDTIQQQPQMNKQNDSGIGHDSLDFSSPTGDNVFVFNSPVKSYPPSATMQLSPGTLINKRRTRHISDRSSVSEYCSDEDDSVLSKCTAMPTTKISSLYKKFVSKTQTAFNKFSRLPLLGNIEENLLHNRCQPKAFVDGFKLLLGASGSFCPTQLTIPAQTYFYEFQGIKHMSTPYVCEFRLLRKYSIPRCGTVQATLLNPQGTVVRMFFVSYDFRDMPAMSQTFIRQRVLAIDEHISQKNVEQMSTSEQMKHLRYVINLRFQTGRSGRLCLHTEIKLVISRRTENDTAAAHAKNSLESPNDLKTIIVCPENPKFSSRIEKSLM